MFQEGKDLSVIFLSLPLDGSEKLLSKLSRAQAACTRGFAQAYISHNYLWAGCSLSCFQVTFFSSSSLNTKRQQHTIKSFGFSKKQWSFIHLWQIHGGLVFFKLVWPRCVLAMAILIELFFGWFFFFSSGIISSLGRVIPLLFDFNFVYFTVLPMPFAHKEISLLGLIAQGENSQ